MTRTKELSDMQGEDMIDVRDIIARVEELRDEREASDIPANEYGGPKDSWKDERQELATLESFLDELRGNGGDEQWEGNWYPVTLIHERYFKTYAQELAEDIGAIKGNAEWPARCIDWDQAADELKVDYTTAELGDDTYYYR